MDERSSLNPNQQRFVQYYTTGAHGIRGNATASYLAAGYAPKSEKVAGVNATRLLGNARIQRAIFQVHREADAVTIAQLKDWKVLAPPAQHTIMCLAHGILPVDVVTIGDDAGSAHERMTTRDDAAIGNVMLHAALAILERAYPSKVYADVSLHDPDRLLAAILGVPVEALPATTASRTYAAHNGHASFDG